MGKQKQQKRLTWEDFQSLGNPENAPEIKPEKKVEQPEDKSIAIRISLDKKGRKGKKVTLIKGLNTDLGIMEDLAKELKTKCGVGGSVKEDQIILQGDQRNPVKNYLQLKGYTNVKIAGA